MRVICDTNIWYNLGNGNISPDSVNKSSKLLATYVNIDELSRTLNLFDDIENARNAIIAIFKYNGGVIYEPPIVYLKKIFDPNYYFSIENKLGGILEFTQSIANGYDLSESKKEDFKKYCLRRGRELQEACDHCNAVADEIRNRIKKKKGHRKEDSIPINREFISSMVAVLTDINILSEEFDWGRIELFESTLKEFFNELELSTMKIQPNDWFDLFQLVYVQPGSSFWTKERRWINMIKKAGMEEYLYEK